MRWRELDCHICGLCSWSSQGPVMGTHPLRGVVLGHAVLSLAMSIASIACTEGSSPGSPSSSSTPTAPSQSSPTPSAQVDKTTVTFPTTTLGTTSSTTFVLTVSSVGTAALQLSDLINSDSSSFPTSSTCPIPGSLAPGSSCTLTVSFHPSVAGVRSAQISVRTNGGTLVVNATGTGSQPVNCSVVCWACAENSYGAIAYSTGAGSCGWSFGLGSRSAAESEAIRQCARGDCFAAAWFQNQCGALARTTNDRWSSAVGSSRSVAESAALAQCSAR